MRCEHLRVKKILHDFQISRKYFRLNNRIRVKNSSFSSWNDDVKILKTVIPCEQRKRCRVLFYSVAVISLKLYILPKTLPLAQPPKRIFLLYFHTRQQRCLMFSATHIQFHSYQYIYNIHTYVLLYIIYRIHLFYINSCSISGPVFYSLPPFLSLFPSV